MKTMTKGTYLTSVLSIPKSYTSYTICHSYPKEWKLISVKTLVCNLIRKEKYNVHRQTLEQALEHGLILEKVHRVIEFSQ